MSVSQTIVTLSKLTTHIESAKDELLIRDTQFSEDSLDKLWQAKLNLLNYIKTHKQLIPVDMLISTINIYI
ncbi:MAG: hypothetical protein DRG78_00210 [Epsilonproteobacteria bacterium]|nr:MAG: hypothetical protein DRG78_00210 [Campylobacterota bacterium]